MFFGRKYRFRTSQAKSYPTKLAVFHLGKIRKFRKIPTQIPEYFSPFLTSWLDLALPKRSDLKKAARRCPWILIWSHEGPNQAQNYVFERSRCQPVNHFGSLSQNMASRLDKTQNFASRLDETTGFDRHVPNLREGCLRQPCRARGKTERQDRILYHMDVRTPQATD